MKFKEIPSFTLPLVPSVQTDKPLYAVGIFIMKTIYTLEHPLTKEIKYVGVTSLKLKNRLWKHTASCKLGGKYPLIPWIFSLVKQDLKPVITIIEEVNDAGAYEAENFWIIMFNFWGFDLLNVKKNATSTYPSSIKKPVMIYKDNFEKRFSSCTECSLWLNVHETTVHKAVKNGSKFLSGYKIKYIKNGKQ